MKVFLSYAHNDGRPHVEKLNAALEKRAFTPWYDKRLNPARTFEVEIETAIEEAEAVIVCLTPAAVRKESFVRNEILYAQALKRPVYAARFADVMPPATIIGHTWLDFFREDWNAIFNSLCDWLHNPPVSNATLSTTESDPFKPYLERALQSIVDGLRQRLIAPEPLELNVRQELGAVDTSATQPSPPDPFAQAFSAVRLYDEEPAINVPEPTFTNFKQAVTYFKQRLLLLGEPGAGKTITLMDYARQAFFERLENSQKPLPLFGLVPTWDVENQTPITDWLAQEHRLNIDIVRKEIDAGRVLLLLDGLDELGSEREEKKKDDETGQEKNVLYDPRVRFLTALQTINPSNGIVLTSRVEEYQQIGKQAALNGALHLQPLAWKQIQIYLRVGHKSD